MNNTLLNFCLTLQKVSSRLDIVELGSYINLLEDGMIELQLAFVERKQVLSILLSEDVLEEMTTDALIVYITMEYDASCSGQRSVAIH